MCIEREQWEVGESAWFEYHCWESLESADAELWLRSHQRVVVVGEAEHDGWPGSTREERTEAGQPKVYTVHFADGFEGDATEDELMTSRAAFERPAPPARGK